MNTTPKKFCFVLMPFEKEFDDIYQLGIKQSCIDAGAYCERVDEQIYHESILERIYNQISKADIVIADMTSRNPNVFYEVGYAHALGKTTILLTQNASDIPFDLKHYPHIIYDNKILKLKDDLTSRVKWCIENEQNDVSSQIEIDVYLEGKSLSSGDVEFTIKEGRNPNPKLVLYNTSVNTYNPGDYSIGIVTDDNYAYMWDKHSKTIKLPDGRLLHMCPFINDILYPGAYANFQFTLISKTISYAKEGNTTVPIKYTDSQKIIIRLFSPIGSRDFPLKVIYDEKDTRM